jgi:hypothetical protein
MEQSTPHMVQPDLVIYSWYAANYSNAFVEISLIVIEVE